MQALPSAVKKFFDRYPHVNAAFETYNGSVYPTEVTAKQSVYGHANKSVIRHERPAADKAKKKD